MDRENIDEVNLLILYRIDKQTDKKVSYKNMLKLIKVCSVTNITNAIQDSVYTFFVLLKIFILRNFRVSLNMTAVIYYGHRKPAFELYLHQISFLV